MNEHQAALKAMDKNVPLTLSYEHVRAVAKEYAQEHGHLPGFATTSKEGVEVNWEWFHRPNPDYPVQIFGSFKVAVDYCDCILVIHPSYGEDWSEVYSGLYNEENNAVIIEGNEVLTFVGRTHKFYHNIL